MSLHRTASILMVPYRLTRGFSAFGLRPAPSRGISTQIEHRLQLLQDQFRSSQISYSIGYGLGVIQQAGYDKLVQPQVDLIHIVEDPMQFHATNSKAHPKHYSALLLLGLPIIRRVQNMGAGVYFNPYVKMQDANCNTTVVKYGVVARRVALQDLLQWNSLYIAGRLHKPVKYVHEADESLRAANQYNLHSVFALATLLLSKKSTHVSLTQIFEKIAAISYMGDPRMLVGGENPNKVKNIVSRQHALFEQLYEQAIAVFRERGLLKKCRHVYTINLTPQSTSALLNNLPGNFKRRLLASYRGKYSRELLQDKNVEEFLCSDGRIANDSPFLHAVSTDNYLGWTLRNTVLGIIAYPALIQSLKGIFTAGISKSAKYAWEKKMKSISGH